MQENQTPTNNQKSNIWLELLRFVIIGGGATIIDFLCQMAVKSIPVNQEFIGWIEAIAVTVGFLVSTVFNYIFSLIWVFQDVKDEKKARSKLYMFLFVLFSAIGLGIGIGLQYLGRFIVMQNFVDATGNPVDISTIGFQNFNLASGPFWCFLIVFVLKTCVTLVYNYLTRKLILFKAK